MKNFEKQTIKTVVSFVIVATLMAVGAMAAAASIRITGRGAERDAAIQDAASRVGEECIRSGAAPYPTYSYTVVETHNNNPSGQGGDWYATIETDCQP
jgi:hypothetical protein